MREIEDEEEEEEEFKYISIYIQTRQCYSEPIYLKSCSPYVLFFLFQSSHC